MPVFATVEEVERIIKCNEEVKTEEVTGEKEIIVSDVDPDSGMLYKSDKEKMFGYNTSVICDNNNYILTVDTNGSNVHDSVSFYQSFDNLTTASKYFPKFSRSSSLKTSKL